MLANRSMCGNVKGMRPHSWLLFACLFALATPSLGASELMKTLDADNDGIVDLNDVRVVARGICDHLLDKEPSLAHAPKESQDRFKRRFLELVTALFKAADVHGDGKLDEEGLRTPAGRNLEKLLTQH